MLMAYGTKRTLILSSKDWSYQRDGWERVFLPLVKTLVFLYADLYSLLYIFFCQSETCTEPIATNTSKWPGTFYVYLR